MFRKLKQDLAEVLELPLDVSLDLPKIVIVGELGVLVQNHRGLIHSPSRIVVESARGRSRLRGIPEPGGTKKICSFEATLSQMSLRGRKPLGRLGAGFLDMSW